MELTKDEVEYHSGPWPTYMTMPALQSPDGTLLSPPAPARKETDHGAATLTPQTGRVTGPGAASPDAEQRVDQVHHAALHLGAVATTVLVMVGIGLLGGWGIASGMEQMEVAARIRAAAGMDSSLLYRDQRRP